MILGDPYKFAIIIKTIKEWNLDEAFCNGILLFCIDGSIFPKEICTATLKSEIGPLRENLENIAVDTSLFYAEKGRAFKQIYNMIVPADFTLDNDYRFDISPLSFADENCYTFAVSNGTQVRILAAKLEYNKELSRHELKNTDIKEAFISLEELSKIAKALCLD